MFCVAHLGPALWSCIMLSSVISSFFVPPFVKKRLRPEEVIVPPEVTQSLSSKPEHRLLGNVRHNYATDRKNQAQQHGCRALSERHWFETLWGSKGR